jgi:hypothetical protein
MSNLGDTLKKGTRVMAGLFGQEDSVPAHSGLKERRARAERRARRQSVDFQPDEEALGAARRRTTERQRARGGRLATMLSDSGSDRLGG